MFRFLMLLVTSCLVVSPVMADETIQPVDPQLGREVSFYQDVYPILESKCLACHSATVTENDLSLESAEHILKGGASGEGAVPGKPEESYVYQVAAQIEEPVMPPLPNKVQAKPLTPRELGILRQWIQEGAQGGTKQTDDNFAWQPIPESYKAVYSLAISPDERFIYAGRGNRIFVYDLVTRQEFARISDPGLLAIRQDGEALYGSGVAHRDFVHALAVSPDGRYVASGGYRVVKLWEKLPPTKLIDFQLSQNVRQLAVSEDGVWAAFLLQNGAVRMWNLVNGSAGPVVATEHGIQAIAVLGESERLVTGDEGGLVYWSIATGEWVATRPTSSGVTALAARDQGHQILAGHADNVIRLWASPDEASDAPDPLKEFAGHSQPVTALKVLPNGNEMISGSRDAHVKIWNLENGEAGFSQNLGGPVTDVAVSPDGQSIVASGENQIARIWKRDGKSVADLKGDLGLTRQVVARTDDQTVAKAQFQLADQAQKDAEKDVQQREESVKKATEQKESSQKTLAEKEQAAKDAQQKVDEAEQKLAASPEDEGLKKVVEEAKKALETADGEQMKAQDALASATRAVELSEQSLKIAQANLDQRKTARTQAETRQKQADEALAAANDANSKAAHVINSVAVSSDGAIVFTAGEDQPVQSWGLSGGQGIGPLELSETPRRTQLTANGSLVSVSAAHRVSVWDVSTSWQLVATLGGSPENPLDVSESAFADRVTALAFSPDGSLLATGGGEPSRGGELLFWSVPDGDTGP